MQGNPRIWIDFWLHPVDYIPSDAWLLCLLTHKSSRAAQGAKQTVEKKSARTIHGETRGHRFLLARELSYSERGPQTYISVALNLPHTQHKPNAGHRDTENTGETPVAILLRVNCSNNAEAPNSVPCRYRGGLVREKSVTTTEIPTTEA